MNLVDYYVTNIQAIYDKINHENSLLAQIYPDDFKDEQLKISPPSDTGGLLNRAAYLWTLKAIRDLQQVLDAFLDNFNDQGIYDPKLYKPTDRVVLWIPERLALDDEKQDGYKPRLDDDFKRANELVDNLIDYAKVLTDKLKKEG